MSTSSSSGPMPLDPQAFGLPAESGPVKLLQTHIGWVYLIGEHAFKVKKPVKFDFLDFTSLEQRRWACDREVALNRRLCKDLYLGIRPVYRTEAGPRLADSESSVPEGALMDYAVWMRRLPEACMLDRLLDENAVSVAQIERIAALLSEFYRAQRGQIASGGLGDLESVRHNAEENIREGRALDRSVLAEGALKLIDRRARRFLEKYGGLIRQRAREGFIADGHGDLRAENICLPPQADPVLFDCIEFNDRFRICDSALDAAFLAMELEARRRPDLSHAFMQAYRLGCDPSLPEPLFNFYAGYRAFVKAKVEAWIQCDPHVDPAQQAAAGLHAKDFFDLAVRHALHNERVLIVFCGVAGSGKSTLADELSRRLQCARFSTDAVRNEIIPLTWPREERYQPSNSFRVYMSVLDRAGEALRQNRIAIADGTFSSAPMRARAVQTGKEAGACCVLVWTNCPPGRLEAHLETRLRKNQLRDSEAGLAVALRQHHSFEIPKLKEGFDGIVQIDTSTPESVSQAELWQNVLDALAERL